MKKRNLLSMHAVFFVLLTAITVDSTAMAAEKAINPRTNNPLSTERDPGPPALSPAETRAVQEQQIIQNQQNNGLGTVPLNNGGASAYPQDQSVPVPAANGSNGNGTTNSTGTSSGTPPTPSTSTVPSVPVQPTTGNPGVQ